MTAITGPWQKAQELGLTNTRATADGVVGEIGEYIVGIREDGPESTLRRVSPEIEQELRDKEVYIMQLEAGLREAAHPDCYGCQGTGLIRWPGIIDGKPCPCLTRRTED